MIKQLYKMKKAVKKLVILRKGLLVSSLQIILHE